MENENIIYRNECGIEFIQFKRLLDLGIMNAYTLKGKDTDFTFNKENSKSSYDRICNALGIKMEQILVPKQAHTDIVICANENTTQEDLVDIDGIITDKKDIVLATRNADCILFMFYDPAKKVIANVHSGWKGTFKKIAQKTVVKMMTNYGCKAEDILCFISPSIRKCHFEVDEDLKELCEEIFDFEVNKELEIVKEANRNNIENPKIAELVIEKGEIVEGKQKYFIDTVLINQILLEDVGLKHENIIDSGLCSFCNQDKINSARAEGKGFKRAIALIKM